MEFRKKKNDCHLKNICNIDLILHVHTLGSNVHLSARYEVSMIKSVAKIVHR